MLAKIFCKVLDKIKVLLIIAIVWKSIITAVMSKWKDNFTGCYIFNRAMYKGYVQILIFIGT